MKDRDTTEALLITGENYLILLIRAIVDRTVESDERLNVARTDLLDALEDAEKTDVFK